MSIETELDECLKSQPESISKESCIVPRDLLERTIIELTHLRSLAGVVTEGESFAQLKKRQGPQNVGES